nr:Chain E, Retinoblastoma-like protein 2 [Homo sapiens]4XI9_F Chain F, Retinoblastoma-like protein 2 [Homo sapiens]4XI9_G Chain G, Retinoblastoma-like protein 2 [Homo sapiens]4XI9_H Chain H, Retinoblastoma-like protein 2 [Homo sapiens]5C1D_C Chain C, Retinoblastoma-like protein 2 [Homo sapiens]
VTPVSTAA